MNEDSEKLDQDIVPNPSVDDQLDETDHDRLVAYLDGELSDAETQSIEIRLGNDDSLRNNLRELQTTWDMLDELPRTQPGDTFVKSTIELAIQSNARKRTTWYRWPIRIAAVSVAFAAMAWVAFSSVRNFQNAEFHSFVEDLQLYERYDMYAQVPLHDIVYLEKLLQENLFDEPALSSNETRISAKSGMDRFDELTGPEIADLKKSKERFEADAVETQQRIRRLHQLVIGHPQSRQLLENMQRYSEWTASIDDVDVAYELLGLPVDQWAGKIEEIRGEQAEEFFGRSGDTMLPKEDTQTVFRWCQDFFRRKKPLMIDLAKENSTDVRRWQYTKPGRVFNLFYARHPDLTLQLVNDEDVQNLSQKLSQQAVEILQNVESEEKRSKLIVRWLRAVMQAQFESQFSEADLLDFYENQMTDQEKKRADVMVAGDRKEFISVLYQQHLAR